ncbi:hypothetical protein ABENE_20755 [Asticcacaulis benevestitus DSM 16100 = ATCC BAA-896]|uniref:Uncharacterized protein n=1 Tax=Asticcacaulis benevestitus DSM 16100 = ATCC BAA-896 TaxID=1121022 RepID=V4QUE0_9CAUL|nr:hypothetical protein ABENE_20755 [Asticcacaulis benevestitus DSM 16100 = ATCC BAA-896]
MMGKAKVAQAAFFYEFEREHHVLFGHVILSD